MANIDDPELVWRKSTRSAAYGACVEVATAGGMVFVRDSKDPDGPWLELDRENWAAFVAGVRGGEFDLESPIHS